MIERGDRLLGSVHAAYFYKGLSLIGEWQYGYGGYAFAGHPASVQVPFSGFYVVGGLFPDRRGGRAAEQGHAAAARSSRPGKAAPIGPGAWELVTRVSELRLGEKIFTSGFADPNLWSNQAVTTELGLNWYWNEYIKMYMFWLHGEFADPVAVPPGRLAEDRRHVLVAVSALFLNAVARSWEGEPPGEPSASAGSAGASPSRNHARRFKLSVHATPRPETTAYQSRRRDGKIWGRPQRIGREGPCPRARSCRLLKRPGARYT